MAHVLDCHDVHFLECPGEIRGGSEEEVVEKVIEYARRNHNIHGVLPSLLERLRSSVMEEPEVW